MGYAAVWKVLEEMIVDLRKKGTAIPSKTISDLQSAKILLNISETNVSGETLQQIDTYLQNVESYAVSEEQKLFGSDHADKWLNKLGEAAKMSQTELEHRFVVGLPRAQKWIRIKPSEELPIEKIKRLTEKTHLTYKTQKGGTLLIYGEDAQIRNFVKQMTMKNKLRNDRTASKL